MSPLFAFTCLLLVAATSATGVRGGNGDDVATLDRLEGSRELGAVKGYTFSSFGCFTDKKYGRVFDLKTVQHEMTAETCAQRCISQGPYKYFGLQNGNGCWCGNDHARIGMHGRAPMSECNTACSGNPLEKCGGHWKVEAFELVETAPTSPVHLGCFKDKPDRVFKGPLITQPTTTTPASCQKACGPSYKYFGLQYRDECFCGRASEDFERYGKSNGCSLPCSGDRTETCGGVWAMDVFDMGG